MSGFEVREQGVDGGGIMATGNYPGAARTADELRGDAARAFSLIPGKLRFSLHPRPLLMQWAHKFRQLIQKRYQI